MFPFEASKYLFFIGLWMGGVCGELKNGNE